jgi:hypothetical protein
MSLINEALKKAQRQRSLDAAPLSSAPSGVAAAAVTTHVRAASHRRSYAPVWFGLGLLVLGVGTTVVIMRYGIDSGPAPAPVAARPAPVAVAVTQPVPVTTTPATARAPASPTTEAAVVLPPIAPIPSAPATPPPSFVPTPPAVVATPPATAPAAEPAPVAVEPVNIAALGETERAALVYSFLDTARLTGVRGTGTSARVLMNERVYRLNDIVDAALGLRLSAVRPNLMVFTDAQGKTYEKPY